MSYLKEEDAYWPEDELKEWHLVEKTVSGPRHRTLEEVLATPCWYEKQLERKVPSERERERAYKRALRWKLRANQPLRPD